MSTELQPAQDYETSVRELQSLVGSLSAMLSRDRIERPDAERIASFEKILQTTVEKGQSHIAEIKDALANEA